MTPGPRFHRAYAVLAVQDANAATRTIRGVATTPTPDRAGDVIEPLGIAFKNPLPLLWQHDPRLPVGLATFDAPTKDGVTFEATLPRVADAGTLKDRIDEAYHSLVHQLIRGVSIGFGLRGPAKDAVELMKSGGLRFKATEVLELSLVTIPANADAVISTIKRHDVGATLRTATDELRRTLARPGPSRWHVRSGSTFSARRDALDELLDQVMLDGLKAWDVWCDEHGVDADLAAAVQRRQAEHLWAWRGQVLHELERADFCTTDEVLELEPFVVDERAVTGN